MAPRRKQNPKKTPRANTQYVARVKPSFTTGRRGMPLNSAVGGSANIVNNRGGPVIGERFSFTQIVGGIGVSQPLVILIEPTTNTQTWSLQSKNYDGFVVDFVVVEWISACPSGAGGTLCMWYEFDDLNESPTPANMLARCRNANGASGNPFNRVKLVQHLPKAQNRTNFFSIAVAPDIPSTVKGTCQGVIIVGFSVPPNTTTAPGEVCITYTGRWRKRVLPSANDTPSTTASTVLNPAYAGLTSAQARLAASGRQQNYQRESQSPIFVFSTNRWPTTLARAFNSLLAGSLGLVSGETFPAAATNTMFRFDRPGATVVIGIIAGATPAMLDDYFTEQGWAVDSTILVRPVASGIPDYCFDTSPIDFVMAIWPAFDSMTRISVAYTDTALINYNNAAAGSFIDTIATSIPIETIASALRNANIVIMARNSADAATFSFSPDYSPLNWEQVKRDINLAVDSIGYDQPCIVQFSPSRLGKVYNIGGPVAQPGTRFQNILDFTGATNGGYHVIGYLPTGNTAPYPVEVVNDVNTRVMGQPIAVNVANTPLATTDTNIALCYDDGQLSTSASQRGQYQVAFDGPQPVKQSGDFNTTISDGDLPSSKARVTAGMLAVQDGVVLATAQEFFCPTDLPNKASLDIALATADRSCDVAHNIAQAKRHSVESYCGPCSINVFADAFKRLSDDEKLNFRAAYNLATPRNNDSDEDD